MTTRLSGLLGDVSGPAVRGRTAGAERKTLVEVELLARSEELERILAGVGVPLATLTGKRRKWSELGGFDRSSFDYESYRRSLKGEQASPATGSSGRGGDASA